MNKIINWLGQSNCYKHLIGSILVCLCSDSIYCALYAVVALGWAFGIYLRLITGREL